jgi:hypothetical protein
MSIDHHYYVAVGMRDSETRRFTECRDAEAKKMIEERGWPEHQVFLAHGATENAIIAIDEQFYFEDAEDARWFFNEGYKRMLYEGEAAPDRMAMWIDGKEAGEVGYDTPVPGAILHSLPAPEEKKQ